MSRPDLSLVDSAARLWFGCNVDTHGFDGLRPRPRRDRCGTFVTSRNTRVRCSMEYLSGKKNEPNQFYMGAPMGSLGESTPCAQGRCVETLAVHLLRNRPRRPSQLRAVTFVTRACKKMGLVLLCCAWGLGLARVDTHTRWW